ncbi:MAG: hypothetical protein V1886_00680 [archaeon]
MAKEAGKKFFPKIKQELKNFLNDEEGTISKDKIIKAGVILANIILMSQPAAAHSQATHSNDLSQGYASGTATATHSHHASHSQTEY